MSKRLLYLLIALLSAFNLHGQDANVTITGSVTDEQNIPIPGISVAIKGTTIGSATDANGIYRITSRIPAGSYQLSVSGIGYKTQTREVEVSGNVSVEINFTLAESIEQLQSVEILGRRETGYANSVSFIATKTATPFAEIPQSIGYVTKELALDQAAFRVNDVVKNISGVNQFSFYNDITIRGFRVSGQDNSGNLVNGMRTFTSFWKQQLIPHIERVEVIKGPSSALFGNASPGGTINRVTKKPLRTPRQSVTTTVGSFNTFRTMADFTGPVTEDKTLLYRMNLGYENSGSFRDLQYDKNLVVAPSFSFLPDDKTRLNLDIVYQNSEGRLDRGQAVFGTGDLYSVPISKALNAANDYLKEETINATLSLRHSFSEKVSFNSIFMRSSYREDLLEHRTANSYATLGDGSLDPEKVEMRVFIRKRNWNNDNFNNYFNIQLETGRMKHDLLVGYDYFQQVLEPGGSQLQARGYLNAERTGTINRFDPNNASAYALDPNGNPIPNVPHFDLTDPTANRLRDMSNYIYRTDLYPQNKLASHGIYVQDQISVGDFRLLLGLRKDFYQEFLDYRLESEERIDQSALIPRVGLVYMVAPYLNLYATWVKGYQPQSSSVINDPNAGGPFDPLTSELYETGAKSVLFDGSLNLSLSVYHLTQRGSLYNANSMENPDLLVQIGEEVSKGIEFDVVGRISDNWNVVANYAFNEATITESDDESEIGRQKPNAPRHAGNVWTKYTLTKGMLKGVGFGAGFNFVSERFGSIISTDEPPVFPGYELFDLAFYYQVNKFNIQANLNNVFNKTHWVGGYDYLRAFPGAPRNILITVNYVF